MSIPHALLNAPDEDDIIVDVDVTDGPAEVTVCQGPPICALEGDEAVSFAASGCVWCRRITIHQDGTESEIDPGRPQ